MKTIFAAALLITFAMCPPVFATKIKGADGSTILAVGPSSVTVFSAGTQRTYKITESTKITVNGIPATWRDLRGGMAVNVGTGSDNVSAQSIKASNPSKPNPNPTPRPPDHKKKKKN